MNASENKFNNMPDIPSSQIALRQLCVSSLMLALAACAARTPAPVSDARPATGTTQGAPVPTVVQPPPPATAALPGSVMPKPNDPAKIHVIQRGDTMFSVARQYGLDYRELAAWNNIVNPTAIRLGETLRLTSPSTPGAATTDAANQVTPTTNSTVPLTAGEVITTPLVVTPPIVIEKPLINTPTVKVEPKASKLAYTDQAYAQMQAESVSAVAPPALPVTGLIPSPPSLIAAPPVSSPPSPMVSTPTPAAPTSPATVAGMPDWSWPVKGKIVTTFTETTKGIDIAGTRGKPVLAAAAGKVIYNEAGLRGYGRMIIIKHNEQWLTAYAHNEKILVQKDQEIKQGQKIAEMGSSDTDTVKLHFEIRKMGKPVDPMKYLPAQ